MSYFSKVNSGLQVVKNIRKYVKYIEATVKVVDYAIEQFSGISDTPAAIEETQTNENIETENA